MFHFEEKGDIMKNNISDMVWSFFVMVISTLAVIYIAYSKFEPVNEKPVDNEQLIEIKKTGE